MAAVTCDPKTLPYRDGDAPFWLKAPSYTIVLLMSGVLVFVSVFSEFCSCDAFWLVLGPGQKVIW